MNFLESAAEQQQHSYGGCVGLCRVVSVVKSVLLYGHLLSTSPSFQISERYSPRSMNEDEDEVIQEVRRNL